MPKISWITSTTGVLLFDSGYTRRVSTARSPCFTVTHSRWRGDFSSVALAQSWARVKGEASSVKRTSRPNSVRRFMSCFLPQEKLRPPGRTEASVLKTDNAKISQMRNERQCRSRRGTDFVTRRVDSVLCLPGWEPTPPVEFDWGGSLHVPRFCFVLIPAEMHHGCVDTLRGVRYALKFTFEQQTATPEDRASPSWLTKSSQHAHRIFPNGTTNWC